MINLDDIKDSTEKTVSFVDWLAVKLLSKNWVTKLLLIDVLLFVVFNPAFFPTILKLFTAEPEPPDWYRLFFWLMIGSVFVAALIVAVRTRPATPASPGIDVTKGTAVKGLLPFRPEDAELFKRLERQHELQACLNVIADRDFRFGILFGESGCGKTSFLQAGLGPALPLSSTTHQAVYVKFSNLDPLATLRQAFQTELKLPPAEVEALPLPVLFESINQKLGKTLVLFFDQFEQFFTQFPRPKQRQPFIAALAEWYRQSSTIPVKILLCLRKDYYAYHLELQKKLQYSLSQQSSIELEKFTPKQATEIFQVIAETAGLPFDRGFVGGLTERELASKEDGLISPVDIQILALVVSQQKKEGGLNRTAFQKLGGVEGLLESYVDSNLEVLATESERQVALKVMLALIDLEHNLRAGILTAEQIGQKLGPEVSAQDRQKAIDWLVQSDVRLLAPVESEGKPSYELSHERLIQPLRNIANKQLTEVSRANLLLERRVNAWADNDYDSRYLLRWGELRQIQQLQSYLVWGKNEAQKRNLLEKSWSRMRRFAGLGAFGIVLLVGLGWSWPALVKMQSQRHVAAQRAQLLQLLNDPKLSAKERVAQVHHLTLNGDPRSEVTTLDKMQFCYVPGGPFWMGSEGADEKPLHLNEHLKDGYWISRFPITVAQFRVFVSDSGANARSVAAFALDERDNRPVTNVTWHNTLQFCSWLTRKWQREGRIPRDWQVKLTSEAEWEKAARGGSEIPKEFCIHTIDEIKLEPIPKLTLQKNSLPQRLYPWGDTANVNFANSVETGFGSISAVGCFPGGVSPYGCEDMAGNVLEWTRSLWGTDYRRLDLRYPYDPQDGREDLEASGSRVLRGGAFNYNAEDARCAYRFRHYPSNRFNGLGFRVLLSP